MRKEIRRVDPERKSRKGLSKLPHPSGQAKTCQECGQVFVRRQTESTNSWDRRKYCSLKCYGRVLNANLPSSKNCLVCGVEFTRVRGVGDDAGWLSRKYCSPACAVTMAAERTRRVWEDPHYREHMSAVHTGKPSPLKGKPSGRPSWNKGVPHSDTARAKNRAAHLGRRTSVETRQKQSATAVNKRDQHHAWKGGITPENATIRRSLKMRLWRESVFSRDQYTCVSCGAKNGQGKRVVFHADHIKPFAYFPELRFEVSNGRTLCVPCHKETDSYAWKAVKNYA